jgi:hypothetical protein
MLETPQRNTGQRNTGQPQHAAAGNELIENDTHADATSSIFRDMPASYVESGAERVEKRGSVAKPRVGIPRDNQRSVS